MAAGLLQHVNEVIEGVSVCSDWHAGDFAVEQSAYKANKSALEAELLSDVRPESIAVGGHGLSLALSIEGSFSYAGELPKSTARLERWVADEDTLVWLHKTRTLRGFRDLQPLADQYRDKWRRLPSVVQRRTLKIAHSIFADEDGLSIHEFTTPDELTDDAFVQLREATNPRLAEDATPLPKGAALRGNQYLRRDRFKPLDEANARRSAYRTAQEDMADKKLMEELGPPPAQTNRNDTSGYPFNNWVVDLIVGLNRLVPEMKPDSTAVEAILQRNIHKHVHELVLAGTSLRRIVPVVQRGRHVYPSSPQHDVSQIRPLLSLSGRGTTSASLEGGGEISMTIE